MDGKTKEVYFNEYCKICKSADVPGDEEPCNECLEYPTNEYSHKPVNYKPQ